MSTVIETIEIKTRERSEQAELVFSRLVLDIVEGDEPDASECEAVLVAADKTIGELKAAVGHRQSRNSLRGIIEQGRIIDEERIKIDGQIRDAGNVFAAAKKKLNDTVRPLQARVSADERPVRNIPVTVRGHVPVVVAAGETIPLTISIFNGLDWRIRHDTYSVKPTNWNGETINITLVDIYRDGSTNRYLAAPQITPPRSISGLGSHAIDPGKLLDIRTDARNWTLRDGWLPGRYKATVAVMNLRVDHYTTMRVMSEPFEFEIK